MLGTAYRSGPRSPLGAQAGQVSCYAWGPEDYHVVIHRRLKTLCRRARELDPSVQVRGVVDTAPLLEREFAQLAGLGWVGKNTLLLNRQLGSWFFLAALLLDCELEYDEPFRADHCGSCTACLDACPTDAFAKPYVLDARRCISYLTIELRGPMDRPLRARTGTWVFGCDICQDVCPWNRRTGEGDPAFEPRLDLNPLALASLFALDDAAFRARFRQTPLWRARRRGLLRNAAIALGNQPNPAALPALITGLHDADPLVRGACAWALGQFTTTTTTTADDDDAVQALAARLVHEPDAAVRDEIRRTLEEAGG
jgi:epoxyqueuosine reductase